MFGDTVNRTELANAAKELVRLLEKYRSNNQSASRVLDRSRDLFESAINQQITIPLKGGFFPEEFWEEGELFSFDDLGEAVARFNLLLRGAASVSAIKQSVHAIESQAAKEEEELRRKS